MKLLFSTFSVCIIFALLQACGAPSANAATSEQPSITSMHPTSGPTGTVIEITGRGFTGVTTAWLGPVHDATVFIVSDQLALLTVPSKAKSGTVALGNGHRWGFSSSSFKVTQTSTSTPPSSSTGSPSITSFSPVSGPAGSTITIRGRNLTGIVQAWIGASHNASIHDVSDTEMEITVPVKASSGLLALGNGTHWAFSSLRFDVTSSGSSGSGGSPTPPVSGGGGTHTSGPAAPMALISRGIPSYASSGVPGHANDANYNTYWQSTGVPATLTYDLSTVSAAHRKKILLAWYNDNTYTYDHAIYDWISQNNPETYNVEVNAAAGGGKPPTSGWTVVASVSGNTLHSREHVFDFSGYNWVRMNFTAVDGSPGYMNITVNVDIYDASNGVTDGWFFAGDSITANGMGHANFWTVTSDSFGNQVGKLTGDIPAQENAGMPGWYSGSFLDYLPNWLAAFPGKYVTLNIGTNDANSKVSPATFYANMVTLVQDVLVAGKIPVIPTIPWGRNAALQAAVPKMNAEIQNLYVAFPSIVHGPDLYSLFNGNHDYISTDDIHPTDEGYAALRAAWAKVAATSVYH